jgi:hypothetical protein
MKVTIPHIFTKDFEHLDKIEFLRRVLYVLLLLHTFTLLPILGDLFGYYSLIGSQGWNTSVPWYLQGSKALVNVLSHPANSDREWVYMVFVCGQILFLITGIFKFKPILSSVMVYFFSVNLFFKGGLAFTGGEVLAALSLFYLMFIHKPRSKGWFGDLQNILNNTFYWVLLLQVCVLYFFSALYKFFDIYWLTGHAVQYVSRMEVFGSVLLSPFENNYWLSAIATYSVLAYQGLFGIFVWIKKVKIPFLIFGVVFHLLISFGMGIFNFGLVMIVMYILFLDQEHINKLKTVFKKKKSIESA